jgi:hypothetical protein
MVDLASIRALDGAWPWFATLQRTRNYLIKTCKQTPGKWKLNCELKEVEKKDIIKSVRVDKWNNAYAYVRLCLAPNDVWALFRLVNEAYERGK